MSIVSTRKRPKERFYEAIFEKGVDVLIKTVEAVVFIRKMRRRYQARRRR